MKVYRVELVYANENKKLWGFTSKPIDFIEVAMKGNIKKHPVVNIYAKTGKKIIYSFKG